MKQQNNIILMGFDTFEINLVVTTPTQPQLNSKVGSDMKITLYH